MVNHVAAADDVIGRCMGNFGKWQLRTILIIFLCKLPTSWFMAVIIFTAPTPKAGEYWCRPPDGFQPERIVDWISAVHPMVAGTHQPDLCHVYEDVMAAPQRYVEFLQASGNRSAFADAPDAPNSTESNRTVVPCKNFVFAGEFHSLIAEYNLICSRSLLLNLSQCFHIFGLLLGGIVANMMVKRWSPRRVMLSGMLAQMVCGNATGLVGRYELHVLFRCLSAMTCAMMYTSGQMILVDITGGKARTITSIVFELFWSIGLILLPALSIISGTWSHMYIAISTPTLALLFLYQVIPDSPRWFVRQGKLEQAKEIILEGARVNKIKVPDDVDHLLQMQSDAILAEPPQAHWMELWDGNPRRRHLLCVHYAWAIYVLLFNSMVLNIRAYGPEYIHMNTVIMGFSEMFGVFIGMYLILYTKRRWLWAGLLSISSGILAYLTWFIPEDLKLYHIVALEMIPSIAIKVATSTSMSILTTCTAELVTAEKRKTLMFSSAVWARGWFLWVPFIGIIKVYGPTAPLTVFATLAVIGGILTSLINNSHRRSLKTTTKVVNGGGVVNQALEMDSMKQIAVIDVDVVGSIKMHEKY